MIGAKSLCQLTRVWDWKVDASMNKTCDGNHADFLNERVNVHMILGICARRWCADLPNVAPSRSVNSMSFSDIPADLPLSFSSRGVRSRPDRKDVQ